jgi:hypothetical protein
MKGAALIGAAAICSVFPADGFTIARRPMSTVSTTSLASDFSSDFGSDFGSAMPNLVSPYERIGIDEEELALGVDAEEFLTYLGS